MRRGATRVALTSGMLCALGVIGCIVGAVLDLAAFQRAWLCAYVFWLGVPLGGVTLVLVHDLSGGEWMETARPVLGAAITTMPLATLAGIPAWFGLSSLYVWTHPGSGLANLFYLNPDAFFIRYVIYMIAWNLLAAYALWAPRDGGLPIPRALSWISGLGLVVLALSASFAAIDWILSLAPTFWSSAFPYAQAASWFNTGMALVVLTVALLVRPTDARREHMIRHMADLSRILLATIIFWAYIEFVQFLIIWEENLKTEIPWYLDHLHSVWHPALDVSIWLGFVIPFFVLLWAPSKRDRTIVAAISAGIVASRLANTWQLIMPEFKDGTPFWLCVAAVLALGGAVVLLFVLALPYAHRLAFGRAMIWSANHG
jgi:hypothetical protein